MNKVRSWRKKLKRGGSNLQAIYLEVGAQGCHGHGHASEASVQTSALKQSHCLPTGLCFPHLAIAVRICAMCAL